MDENLALIALQNLLATLVNEANDGLTGEELRQMVISVGEQALDIVTDLRET